MITRSGQSTFRRERNLPGMFQNFLFISEYLELFLLKVKKILSKSSEKKKKRLQVGMELRWLCPTPAPGDQDRVQGHSSSPGGFHADGLCSSLSYEGPVCCVVDFR